MKTFTAHCNIPLITAVTVAAVVADSEGLVEVACQDEVAQKQEQEEVASQDEGVAVVVLSSFDLVAPLASARIAVVGEPGRAADRALQHTAFAPVLVA